MIHKEKIKLARKLRTQKEIKNKVPIFQTKNWDLRKQAKQIKMKKKPLR